MNRTEFVEFVTTVEVNPAYALSTVVHELQGHPVYDEPSGASNYAGKLYEAAAAQVPASKKIDRSGNESFNYWPTEIYSLLKELPYWTSVSAPDAKKVLKLPGSTSSAATLNYDPRGVDLKLEIVRAPSGICSNRSGRIGSRHSSTAWCAACTSASRTIRPSRRCR